jgi:hypothetical protein
MTLLLELYSNLIGRRCLGMVRGGFWLVEGRGNADSPFGFAQGRLFGNNNRKPRTKTDSSDSVRNDKQKSKPIFRLLPRGIAMDYSLL